MVFIQEWYPLQCGTNPAQRRAAIELHVGHRKLIAEVEQAMRGDADTGS